MYRKNTAGQFIHVQGVDATTGGIKTGVSWTVRRCIDGTFAAATGTATEDGSTGWYKFALSQADTNGNDIGFNFTGTGAVPQTINILTTAADPSDGVRFGLTALPNAVPGAAGGGLIAGTNASLDITGALTVGGGIAVTQSSTNQAGISVVGNGTGHGVKIYGGNGNTSTGLLITSLASGAGNGLVLGDTGTGLSLQASGPVFLAGTVTATDAANDIRGIQVAGYAAGVGPLSPIRTGTCQSGSTSTTIKLDSGASATDHYYDEVLIYLTGGTGVGQSRYARKDYDGTFKTLSVNRAWTTTPDNTTTFALLPNDSAWDEYGADHTTAGTVGNIVTVSLPEIAAGANGGLLKIGSNIGTISLSGGLTIGNALTIGTNLTVSGSVSLASLSVSGATAFVGALTATNASNDVRLGATENAAVATAWGASVVGNGRTRDMYLQGMTNKVAFDTPVAGQYTIYASDDTSVLISGVFTTAAVSPVVSLDPT